MGGELFYVGKQVQTDGRADRRDEANIRFPQFCKNA
jgi:hypothetical protein